MVVELKFRQQIAHGDAQERSRREGQSIGQHVAFAVNLPEPQVKEQGAGRNHQREEGVDHVTRRGRPAPDSHQRADRHRIEGLVQEDNEEGSDAGQGSCLTTVRLGLDTGSQGNAGEDRMQRKSDSGTTPSEFV